MTGPQIWATNPESWLAAIVDSSEDAIVGKTLDSVIRSWNAGAAEIFGYTADEIIGQTVLVLIPPERQHEELDIVARLSRGERIRHFETVRVRKDGSYVDVSLSVSPIRDQVGEIVGAAKIARDVTEANRLRAAERELSEQLQEQTVELEQQIEESQSLEEELQQSNDELQEAVAVSSTAQRMAEEASRAKSMFFATMNHELRTPLNAVTGYVDLLEMGMFGPLTEQQRTSLDRIRINGQTLLRLVDDVLDLARLESGRVEYEITEFRIDDLLKTMEAFIAPALRQKGIEYRFEPCGPGSRAWADRGKTEQVLLNLLSNALKFTEAGRIHVRCVSRDEWLHIEVIDTGSGIRPEVLEKLFEPFVRGDPGRTSVQGTGLGLSISRRFARGMGGDLVVSSRDGEGSTFTLVLPAARAGRR